MKIVRLDKSFSLVEIIVAVGILAVSLVAMLGFFSTTFQANKNSYTTSVAIDHAGSILEEIRGRNLTILSMELLRGDWTFDTAGIKAKGFVPLNNEQISTAFSGAGPLTVTVTVTWDQARSVTLTTIMGGA